MGLVSTALGQVRLAPTAEPTWPGIASSPYSTQAPPPVPAGERQPSREVLPAPGENPPAVELNQEANPDEPGYFGAITDDRQKLPGVRLVEVVAGGPAEAAGLRASDLITRVNDHPIREMADLTKIILSSHAEDVWKITYQRGATLSTPGREAVLEMKLGARPTQPNRRYANFGRIDQEDPAETAADRPSGMLLGVRTAPLDLAGRRRLGVPVQQGAMILEVIPGSPAFLARIPQDGVIVSINGLLIDSPDALTREILRIGPGVEVELGYYLGRDLVKRQITLGGAEQQSLPASPDGVPLGAPQLDDSLSPEAAFRIKQLENQVRTLQERLEQLEQKLNAR